jgi:hypothetical protein
MTTHRRRLPPKPPEPPPGFMWFYWGLVPIAAVERHAKAQMRGFDQLSRDLRDMLNADADVSKSKRGKKRGVK